ncbi:MAG: MGMT family protein [Nanobdellota archaeon]
MSFNEKVWAKIKCLQNGEVTTYKEIAKALNTKAYRAVGNALNKNPYWPEVPCHRVIRADGALGGFARGKKEKLALLEKEGVYFESGVIKNSSKIVPWNWLSRNKNLALRS